jgi:hypothetical protein
MDKGLQNLVAKAEGCAQADTEIKPKAHEHVYLQSTKTICSTYMSTRNKTLSALSK